MNDLKDLSPRLLDAVIAEKIMGWKQHPYSNFPWQLVPPECEAWLSSDDPALVLLSVPKYTTEINDTLDVVNKMWELGWQFALNRLHIYPEWCASFAPKYSPTWTTGCSEDMILAICYAALTTILEKDAREEALVNQTFQWGK